MAEGNDKSPDGGNEDNSNMQDADILEHEQDYQDENIDVEAIVQECSKEYSDLAKTLDQIDSWMTNIEDQSDSLNVKIDELLQSNREIRQELQQENQAQKQEKTHEDEPH